MTNDEQPNSLVRGALRFADVERRRESRVRAWRPYAGAFCALLGLMVIGGELYRHWMRNIPMSGTVVLLGAAIGFIGFYMLNHKDAKDGAAFLVTQGIAIVGAVRGGRRVTDPPVVPVVEEEVPK